MSNYEPIEGTSAYYKAVIQANKIPRLTSPYYFGTFEDLEFKKWEEEKRYNSIKLWYNFFLKEELRCLRKPFEAKKPNIDTDKLQPSGKWYYNTTPEEKGRLFVHYPHLIPKFSELPTEEAMEEMFLREIMKDEINK